MLPRNNKDCQTPMNIFSDGNDLSISDALSKGWTRADKFVPSFLKAAKGGFEEVLVAVRGGSAAQASASIQLPHNYALLTLASVGGTLAIFGHPSGQPFRNAIEFLPHFKWLCQTDRFSLPCKCRLCQELYQRKDNQQTIPQLSPSAMLASPFAQQHQFFNQTGMDLFPNLHIPQPSLFNNFPPQSLISPIQPMQFNPSGVSPSLQTLNHTNGHNDMPISVARKDHQHLAKGSANPISTPLVSSVSQTPILSTNKADELEDEAAPNNFAETSSESKTKKPRKKAPAKSDSKPSARVREKALNEETKQKHKFDQLVADNAALELDIQNLRKGIEKQVSKIERIKFERKVLLGSMMTMKDQKRPREDDSSSESAAENELDSVSDGLASENKRGKTPQKRKRRLKLLDPNAPKRPVNAFLMYCDLQRGSINAERRILQKTHPESEALSMTNITKALGARWRTLDTKDTEFYKDIYLKEIEYFTSSTKEYLAAHPNAPFQGATEPLPDGWTDPNAPKNPGCHPFFVFCELEDERLKNEEGETKTNEEDEADLANVSLSLATRWRLLDDAKKNVYVNEHGTRLANYKEYLSNKRLETATDGNQIDNEDNMLISSPRLDTMDHDIAEDSEMSVEEDD